MGNRESWVHEIKYFSIFYREVETTCKASFMDCQGRLSLKQVHRLPNDINRRLTLSKSWAGKREKILEFVKVLSKNPVQPFPSNLLSRQTELSPPLRRFYSYSLREVEKKGGGPYASLTVLNFFFLFFLSTGEGRERGGNPSTLFFQSRKKPISRLSISCPSKSARGFLCSDNNNLAWQEIDEKNGGKKIEEIEIFNFIPSVFIPSRYRFLRKAFHQRYLQKNSM